MYLTTTENPEDAIRQLQEVEQKVDFVENTFLCLPEPVLAHLTVLEGFLRAAKREHNKRRLQFVSLVPEAIEQVEEEMDKFWMRYKEVNYTLAMKLAPAKRSSASPPSEADQIAAEAWLTQQFKAWESLQADIPEHTIESQQARSQTLESQEVAAQDCTLSTGSNQPSSCNSQPREKLAKNACVDTTSNAIVVANHGPQEPAVAVAPEDHPASTGSPKEVTASAKYNELLPVVDSCQVPCLVHPDGGSKAESDPNPAHEPKPETATRPGRVQPDSGQEMKSAAEHIPMLPSTVKAPDKRGQPRSSRIYPDDGALQERCRPAHEHQHQGWFPTVPDKDVPGESKQTVRSGQPDRSQPPIECRRQGWHPSVPPDKIVSASNSLSYLNRGEYVRCSPKKPHRAHTPAPTMSTDS